MTSSQREVYDLGSHLVILFCVDGQSGILGLTTLLNHIVDDQGVLWEDL